MSYNLIEWYERNVLNTFLPNFKVRGNVNWSFSIATDENEDSNPKSLSLPRVFFNKNLYSSPYYLDGQTLFMHYTTIDSLVNILKSNSLRLNELNQVNDPMEVAFGERITGLDKIPYEGMYVAGTDTKEGVLRPKNERLKDTIYALSLCRLLNEEKPDDFNMWEKYGDKGNGVAIIIEVDDINRMDWFNFHLFEMKYGNDQHSEDLKQFINRHQGFKQTENCEIYNSDLFFSTFFAAHKLEHYSLENEVRLLAKLPDWYFTGIESEFIDHFELDVFWNAAEGVKRQGLLLKLRNSYEYRNYDNLKAQNVPAIKIKKILLGYKRDEKTLTELRKIVNNYCVKNNNPVIPIQISSLKGDLGF